MIDLPGAARGLAGAWRLARLDAEGLRAFDNTPEAFRRSFQAAIIAAPLFALVVMLMGDNHPLSSDPVRAVLIESIGYVIDWTAFPVAAWYLAGGLGKSDRYFAYVAAYNWTKVLQLVAFVPVAVFAASDVAADEIAGTAAMIVTAIIVYYQYFIVRHALTIDMLPALGFVSMDLLISVLINLVSTSLQMR